MFTGSIKVTGCREHNLKNLSLSIPKNHIIVITGVSGSGKSSLAFDTLFAEGQRRYLEYLSPDARASLKQMPKPDVDMIEGLSPTLAIGQRHQSLYPRGTVATYTDIYDFLCLLYARIGQQHSPFTGKRLIRYSRQEIIFTILNDYPTGSRIQLIAPIKLQNESIREAILRLQQMGFVRLRINGQEIVGDEEVEESPNIKLDVVVDRLEIKEDIRERLSGSIETALDLGQGILQVVEGRDGPIRYFTEIYVCPETSFSFAPLETSDFNFNSPRGACPACHGLGSIDDRVCDVCHGARLKAASLACLVQRKGIHELSAMTVDALINEIDGWTFEGKDKAIAEQILPHIKSRLGFLQQVGVGYLELNRSGKTLSDGEAQRIQLAAQIGAKLSGILYILDEPSLGLHRADSDHLRQVIDELKNLGNTVILVEHERGLISHADQILELGPGPGIHGGKIVFQGTYPEMLACPTSLTGQWMSGKLAYAKPPKRKMSGETLEVKQATLHNLKDFSVSIPLGCLVGLCGVSGSGKSTLAMDIIANKMKEEINEQGSSNHLKNCGSIQRLITSEKQSDKFSARSIPATYIEVMSPIRSMMAETRLAKARGYTAARFSLNKKGGRCEACEGLGQVRVSMQLMPDLFVPCEVCNGLRYNYETLQVLWEGKSMADILAMTAEEAYEFFKNMPAIAPKLKLMRELGLEYLTLGQPFNTLSSGEIQRVRLVADLGMKSLAPTLYILDEPSAGLHFHDIEKLLKILHRLVDEGHSVIVVEHHIDILRQADWLIELGPGGGPHGGRLVFEGTAAQMKKAKTATGMFF